jgi:hypothetical protein
VRWKFSGEVVELYIPVGLDNVRLEGDVGDTHVFLDFC